MKLIPGASYDDNIVAFKNKKQVMQTKYSYDTSGI